MSFNAGTKLGRYQIRSQLGAGGMGAVFLAEDTRLHRKVALKVLPAEMAANAERLARFQREAQAVAALNHPHIVTLYSVEEAEGATFITMEFVEGAPLEQVLLPGGLPPAQVLDIGIALADALAAAHEKGIIHRDLKPANVMFTKDGRVKVLDFGLAKLAPGPSEAGPAAPRPVASQLATQATPRDPRLTEAGLVMGTVPYMSPEQVKGQTVDSRTDIFSLGVVLYEMATGRRPFGGATPAETIASILRDMPPPLSEIRQDAPRHLVWIIDHWLQKAPEDRFRTAREARDALRAPGAAMAAVEAPQAQRICAPAPRERASIAVLPFDNLSGDPQQEYFADGIVEEIITGLSRIKWLLVISRNSTFIYRSRVVDVTTVGRELGVRYVLRGSVRRSG